MNVREYEDTIKNLIANYCMLSTELDFVESVHDWCAQNGIEERDRKKPLRFVLESDKACRLIVNDMINKDTLEERLNALRVRSALVNVASNKADMLNSEKKKLAYLILSEYAAAVQTPDDEVLADKWVFDEMTKMGFFRE